MSFCISPYTTNSREGASIGNNIDISINRFCAKAAYIQTFPFLPILTKSK